MDFIDLNIGIFIMFIMHSLQSIVYIYVLVHVCVFICVYVCMCVCTNTHTCVGVRVLAHSCVLQREEKDIKKVVKDRKRNILLIIEME